jgi:Holliday junction resolvase RusA-like endonuclease
MITFIIPGSAVGKGRPKAARRGNFITMYTPEKTASYENLVKIKAQEAMNGMSPIPGPCRLELLIEVVVPKAFSQKKRESALAGDIYPTTKPDIDNVLKGISDAMNGIVFDDDKQITDCTIRRRYGVTPQAIVAVTALEKKQ